MIMKNLSLLAVVPFVAAMSVAEQKPFEYETKQSEYPVRYRVAMAYASD